MDKELLTRLVATLESINENLDFINSSLSDVSEALNNIDENLGGCISIHGKSRFLCITGNITAD